MKQIKIDLKNPDIQAITQAAVIIKNGGVVVFPSDTCYGLAADFSNPQAIKKIFQIKKRNINKKLSIVLRDSKMLEKYCQISPKTRRIIQKYLPGAITLILPSKYDGELSQTTLAIRIPDMRAIQMLSDILDTPFTATSANIADQPEIYSSQEIINKLFCDAKIQPDLFLDGGILLKRPPSTILDLTQSPAKILRQGLVKIDAQDLF